MTSLLSYLHFGFFYTPKHFVAAFLGHLSSQQPPLISAADVLESLGIEDDSDNDLSDVNNNSGRHTGDDFKIPTLADPPSTHSPSPTPRASKIISDRVRLKGKSTWDIFCFGF